MQLLQRCSLSHADPSSGSGPGGGGAAACCRLEGGDPATGGLIPSLGVFIIISVLQAGGPVSPPLGAWGCSDTTPTPPDPCTVP